ncbi:MAG: hypothetical protein ACTTN6_01180 [Arsenophonus sp.]
MGFSFFETIKILQGGEEITSQPVLFANINDVKLGIKNDLYLTIPRGHMKDFKFNFILNQTKLQAPLTKNQVVGIINFQLNNKIIEQQPLIVITEVVKDVFFYYN